MEQMTLLKENERYDRHNLQLQIQNAKRFMFMRAHLVPPEDSFEEELQRDFNRFYKDINLGAVKNKQDLRAEILRVGSLMKRENLKSNNRDFLRKAGDNFIKHTKSLTKYFVFIVEGKTNTFRDANTGKFISEKSLK